MRGALLLGLVATGCGAAAATDGVADAPSAPPDARPAVDAPVGDAAPEDLDLTIADLVDLQGLMQPVGRSYRVANPLGHEAEAPLGNLPDEREGSGAGRTERC